MVKLTRYEIAINGADEHGRGGHEGCSRHHRRKAFWGGNLNGNFLYCLKFQF